MVCAEHARADTMQHRLAQAVAAAARAHAVHVPAREGERAQGVAVGG